MIFLLKCINGDEYEISERTRDAIARLITGTRDERPAFVEIEAIGALIATASITSIVKHRPEDNPLLSHEEVVAEFFARSKREQQKFNELEKARLSGNNNSTTRKEE